MLNNNCYVSMDILVTYTPVNMSSHLFKLQIN